MHFVSSDAQQLLMLTGHQRSNEVVGAGFDGLQVLLGVIPLVEDERDVTDTFRKLPTAVRQLIRYVGECHRVVLVAGIGVRAGLKSSHFDRFKMLPLSL